MVPLILATLLAFSAPPPDSPPVVYLDALLAEPSTVFEGNARFRAVKRAQFGSQQVGHALLSEAHMHRSAPARYSSVSFALGKRYKSFEAILGRDNAEQELGRSYCYFEVYADGRRIYSSPAMRSPLSSFVAEGGYAFKVARPQEIKLDVENVETLKLVIQMPEFGQRGDRVDRAAGCTFGEARLTLKPGASPPESAKAEDPAPYRKAIRQALDSLLRKLPESGSEPPKVALAPFRLDAGASGTSAGWWIYLSEQLDGSAGVQPLSGSAQSEFSRQSPEPASHEVLARAARNAGADLVLSGALAETEKGWEIRLELRETADGALVARAAAKFVQPAKPM